MIDLVAGLLMMSGGGLMLGAAVPLARARDRFSTELVAALPHTPLPAPDPGLEQLLASIN